MASHKHNSPYGIEVLKVFCLLAFLSALLDLIFGVLGFHQPYAVREGRAKRLISDLIGLSFGFLFYAVHRRLLIAWKLGWPF
jgi:hypothetical protein